MLQTAGLWPNLRHLPRDSMAVQAREPGTQSLHGLELGVSVSSTEGTLCSDGSSWGARCLEPSDSPVTAGNPVESLHGRRPPGCIFCSDLGYSDHGRLLLLPAAGVSGSLSSTCCSWRGSGRPHRGMGGGGQETETALRDNHLVLTHHLSLYFRKKGLFWMK